MEDSRHKAHTARGAPAGQTEGELAFCQDRWKNGQTGWDFGNPHPHLERLMTAALESGWLEPKARILEPGCGRAHNGAELAQRGFQVVAYDSVSLAIAEAQALYGALPGLTLVCRDALVLHSDWQQAFDAVFDRAMLCALPPARRQIYVQTCFAHLKPDGLFLSLPFSEVIPTDGKQGPPYALSLRELVDLLSPGFAIVHAEERTDGGTDARIKREVVCVWRRRARMLIEGSK